MISFFNKLGNSWVAKGIFFVLGLSMMAFWGIGGISNTSSSDGTALNVGGNKVSVQELLHAFDQERNKMSKISGGYISPNQALSAGLLDQVVQQLLARELKAQIQEELGLTASDNAVRKYIEKNPVFADNLGHFDANLFYAYLSQLGISQNELAKQMRSELAFKHLTDSVKNATPQSDELMKIAAQSQKEQRQIESVLISEKDVLLNPPTNQELQDYYEAYREEFSTPEYRTLRIATLNAADFGKENAYDKMYETARQLEDLLGAGIPLKEACTQLKITNSKNVVVDISGKNKLGQVAEQNLIKNPILEEAFLLSKGEATSLIDLNNGFMVAEVEDIIPMGYKTFDSVKAQVQKLWETENRRSEASKKAQEIVESVRQGNGWKTGRPSLTIISLTKTSFPQKVTEVLLKQDVGNNFVQSIPTENGVLIAVVKKVLPSTVPPTKEELQTATNNWSLDLADAVQASYAGKYPININQSVIQKTFSVYQKEND